MQARSQSYASQCVSVRLFHFLFYVLNINHFTSDNTSPPRQQKIIAMNGAHLASPIRGELGYAHWPQLGTQFIALLGTKFGAH